MIKKLCSFIMVAFLCGAANAAVDSGLVASAEQYLNSITGLNGVFVQTANGKQERGNFAMFLINRWTKLQLCR